MYSRELLSMLKRESETITNDDLSFARAAVTGAVKYVPEPYRSIYSEQYFIFLYENYLRLKKQVSLPKDETVDTDIYNAILAGIRGKNNPGDRKKEAFARFTALVIPYLVFIAKEPLHPVGMLFPGGLKITKKDADYYCPVKDKQSETGISFCEFCICADSGKLEKNQEK